MAIRCKFLPDGGFVAGDTRTGLTSYAFPTSPHATQARRRPFTTAEAMIGEETPSESRRDYDTRNWNRIDGRIGVSAGRTD